MSLYKKMYKVIILNQYFLENVKLKKFFITIYYYRVQMVI